MTVDYEALTEVLHREIEELEQKNASLAAKVERLQAALGMAIYHADNLRRFIDHEVVRDLDESGHGLERARKALNA